MSMSSSIHNLVESLLQRPGIIEVRISAERANVLMTWSTLSSLCQVLRYEVISTAEVNDSHLLTVKFSGEEFTVTAVAFEENLNEFMRLSAQ